MNKTFASGKSDYKVEMEKAAAPEAAQGPGGNKIKIGDKVPELTMTAVDGKTYKLSELKGKYVFIDCWASWCGPCMGEVPNVKALHKALKDRKDFVMIGVSLDREGGCGKGRLSADGKRLHCAQVFSRRVVAHHLGAEKTRLISDGYSRSPVD